MSPLCKDLKEDPSFFESMTFIFITHVNERRICLNSVARWSSNNFLYLLKNVEFKRKR